MKKITTIVLAALAVTLISANFITKSAVAEPAQEKVAVSQQSPEQRGGIIETNDNSWK